jgi:hypothetical protein
MSTVDFGDGVKASISISQKGITVTRKVKNMKHILQIATWENVKAKFLEMEASNDN